MRGPQTVICDVFCMTSLFVITDTPYDDGGEGGVHRPPVSVPFRPHVYESILAGGHVLNKMGALPRSTVIIDDLWSLLGSNPSLEKGDVIRLIRAARPPHRIVITCRPKHADRLTEVQQACSQVIHGADAELDAAPSPYVDARVVDMAAALVRHQPTARELLHIVANDPRMIAPTMLENAGHTTDPGALLRAYLDTAVLEAHFYAHSDSALAAIPHAYRVAHALRSTPSWPTPMKHTQGQNKTAQNVLLRGKLARLSAEHLVDAEDLLDWASNFKERLPAGTHDVMAALTRQLRTLLK